VRIKNGKMNDALVRYMSNEISFVEYICACMKRNNMKYAHNILERYVENVNYATSITDTESIHMFTELSKDNLCVEDIRVYNELRSYFVSIVLYKWISIVEKIDHICIQSSLADAIRNIISNISQVCKYTAEHALYDDTEDTDIPYAFLYNNDAVSYSDAEELRDNTFYTCNIGIDRCGDIRYTIENGHHIYGTTDVTVYEDNKYMEAELLFYITAFLTVMKGTAKVCGFTLNDMYMELDKEEIGYARILCPNYTLSSIPIVEAKLSSIILSSLAYITNMTIEYDNVNNEIQDTDNLRDYIRFLNLL